MHYTERYLFKLCARFLVRDFRIFDEAYLRANLVCGLGSFEVKVSSSSTLDFVKEYAKQHNIPVYTLGWSKEDCPF